MRPQISERISELPRWGRDSGWAVRIEQLCTALVDAAENLSGLFAGLMVWLRRSLLSDPRS